MHFVATSLWFSFAVCLAPLGCSGAVASAKAEADSPQATPVPAEVVQRPASALAYEHYLKARVLIETSQLRAAVGELRQALIYDNGSAHLHVSLGRLYARQGLWRLAAQEAKAALELDAADIGALMLKAASLLQESRPEQALEIYRRVIELDPKRIGAYTRAAAIYFERKDTPRTLATLEQMTTANPDSAEGFRQLGNLYFEQGNEKQAEIYFRRVLQIEPGDTRTTQTLTGLLEQQGRYKEAVQAFIDALETSPENPYYMAIMARLYLKDGDQEAAKAYIDQLRSADSANAGLIARAYAEINRHREAIDELERVLAKNPDEHNERLLVAILYEELKQWPKALEHLRKIPADSRFFLSAQTSIGYSLQHLGKLEEAAQVLNAAIQRAQEPDELGRLYRTLAAVYAKQKQFQQGLVTLDAAIAKLPDLRDLLEAKANLLFEAGRGQEGIAVLTQAIQKYPTDISLLYALGALYERMGKVSESIESMRKLLSLEPHNSSALNFIGYTLADQGQDLEEAEHMIRRALLLNPGNGAITDSLGWVLYKKGQYEQALDYLQRADRITPGEPVIIMHVGDALRKLNRLDQAIQAYRRAWAAEPELRDRAEILKRFEELGIQP
jgi:tetratricopeptide (TPR) repeat protein